MSSAPPSSPSFLAPHPAADAGSIDAMLDQADAALAAGQLDAAQAVLEAVLRLDAGQYDALHLLGVVALQRHELAHAIGLIEQAIAIDPDSEIAYVSLGAAQLEAGRADAALEAFGKAVAIDGTYVEAQFGLGMAQHAMQRWEEAAATFGRVLALQADHLEALAHQGSALYGAKRHNEALAILDRVLARDPNHAAALINRGHVLTALARWEEAAESHARALAVQPERPDLHAARAEALQALGRPDQALPHFEQAVQGLPQRMDLWANRGNALLALGRADEAIASYQSALKLSPDHADVLSNLGGAWREAGQPQEARSVCEAVLRRQPDHAGAWMNLGNALLDMGDLPAARQAFARTAALQPNHVDAHWAQGWAAALNGDWTQGLPLLEWRWRKPGQAMPPAMGRPLWTGGTDLRGRSILLRAEQGLGDTIQFCRYAALLKARGAAKVLLEVQPALIGLLQDLDGVDEVVARGRAPALPFDLHCPLMSLPLFLGTTPATVPASPAYLRADADRVAAMRERLAAQGGGPRVGIVWSGNAAHRDDRRRSMPLATLLEALPAGPRYHVLQKDIRESDLPALHARPDLVHWPETLQDFDDTAALAANMDLIVSVDTSLAHLAGALGRPVWILLSAVPDWRWLMDRADTPWYPSARLIRQDRPGGWAPVVQTLRQSLATTLLH